MYYSSTCTQHVEEYAREITTPPAWVWSTCEAQHVARLQLIDFDTIDTMEDGGGFMCFLYAQQNGETGATWVELKYKNDFEHIIRIPKILQYKHCLSSEVGSDSRTYVADIDISVVRHLQRVFQSNLKQTIECKSRLCFSVSVASSLSRWVSLHFWCDAACHNCRFRVVSNVL